MDEEDNQYFKYLQFGGFKAGIINAAFPFAKYVVPAVRGMLTDFREVQKDLARKVLGKQETSKVRAPSAAGPDTAEGPNTAAAAPPRRWRTA